MAAKTSAESKRRFALDLRSLGPFIALALLMFLGTAINPTFISSANLTNVLTRSAFIGIIAVGATFVISAGGIDLSVGSMAAFISGVMILVMNNLVGNFGVSWTTVIIGMVVSVGLGLTAGMVNGLVTTKGKIDSFIVTLGTMGIYRSLVTYLADGGTLSLDFQLRGIYRPVYYGSFLGIAIPLWAFFIVAVLGWVVLNKTRFCRYCLAI